MIRPLTVILAALAFLAVPAQANASATCSTHIASIDSWSIQAQQIDGMLDFQCGGAQTGNKGDFYLHYYLQYSPDTLHWLNVGCQNGQNCDAVRPTSGLYSGGTEHTTFWEFNVNGPINCLYWRIHVVVVFPNLGQVGPNYNDVQHIGGC